MFRPPHVFGADAGTTHRCIKPSKHCPIRVVLSANSIRTRAIAGAREFKPAPAPRGPTISLLPM